MAGITDRLKEGSAEAVRELREQGIAVWMLTGDGEAAAREVAQRQASTTTARECSPTKEAFIRTLQEEGHTVAMAGDGINDSAALAWADLGIAMGHGSDIAMEAAPVTIISSDLTKIAEAIRLSRLTVRTIRPEPLLGVRLQPDRRARGAGALYPLLGGSARPHDRGGRDGDEQRQRGGQQPASETCETTQGKNR